ncbi:uncharacterized protein IL334_002937 [Kwoniella shivajii]|uniref:Zn(2)-C6 fungal-type domain-containing protein n=1 Tax=Kwoniella shivajii TaxID=564305 RepID=A0ABZ1CWI1_9TREE|nr:hypothetical protein IL334_002937 [Kwoniella shivajii]
MDSTSNYTSRPYNNNNNSNTTPSPFHTSPQTIPGSGTANTSPHSSILSGSNNNTGTGTGTGAGTGTHPSPLVPAYLTRYPNPSLNPATSTSNLDTLLALSTPNLRNNNNNIEMYGGRSDHHSYNRSQHQHQQQHSHSATGWPALPSSSSSTGTGNAGSQHYARDMKEDRGWNNNDEREYSAHSSSSTRGNNNGNSSRYNNNNNNHDSHPNSGSNGNGNVSNPIPPNPPVRQSSQVFPSAGPTAKRGSKACVACRRGKNRCEWDPSGSASSCRRCLLNGVPCVFEKAAEKGNTGRNRNGSVAQSDTTGEADNRVTHLEKTVQSLTQSQDQIQNVLQQILQLLPQSQHSLQTPNTSTLPSYMSSGHNEHPTAVPTSSIFPSSVSPPSIFSTNPAGEGAIQMDHRNNNNNNNNNNSNTSRQDEIMIQAFTAGHDGRNRSPSNTASGRINPSGNHFPTPGKRDFPKLPGFAPPAHQFGTYGVIPLPSAPPSPSRSRHSSRSSSSHSAASSSAIPRETLTAPIQALQALANAADQAAQIAKTSPDHQLVRTEEGDDEEEDADMKDLGILTSDHDGLDEDNRGRSRKRKRVAIDPKSFSLRVKKKKRPDPTPRNPFPDVVTKGLVSESEARELWDIFFKGCHYFVPLWDKSYDTYEEYIVRTPFSMDGLLAVAAKIRAGNGPLGQTFHRCLEEAQGIARSTLFGPIVRKEAVMAMLILSVWSQNGWLPCGHALRMGLDMNLHRALDRLANKDEARSEMDERDLVVSARIWLNCYMHEHLVSLGTGKPLLLRDDSSVRGARVLLSHPMSSETDMRLVAGVELVNLRIRILEHLTPLHGKIDSATISFVKRMLSDLGSWYKEWYSIHRTRYDDEDVLVKLLETELCYAQLWTVCVALRGSQWDKLAPDQRELAFQAKDVSFRCLEIFLRCDNFRKHLKYATHDQLVSVAFAAVFLLKIAMLYPTSVPLPFLISQVTQLAHLLSAECFAERYALTLRLMLSNFRKKTGAMSTMPGTPRMTQFNSGGINNNQSQTLPSAPGTNVSAIGDLDGGLQSFLSLPNFDGLDTNPTSSNNDPTNGMGMFGVTDQMWDMTGLEGFNWPTEFSPSALPVWLQDGNVTDLGLPADGSDSLFLPPELANLFLPSTLQSVDQYVLPDSGDVGAEAW